MASFGRHLSRRRAAGKQAGEDVNWRWISAAALSETAGAFPNWPGTGVLPWMPTASGRASTTQYFGIELLKTPAPLAWHSYPLQCPDCGKVMRFIALIEEPDAVEKIPSHLNLWCGLATFAQARPPPATPRRGEVSEIPSSASRMAVPQTRSQAVPTPSSRVTVWMVARASVCHLYAWSGSRRR